MQGPQMTLAIEAARKSVTINQSINCQKIQQFIFFLFCFSQAKPPNVFGSA